MKAQQSTIVGVFEDRQQADRAVDELRRAGFRDDQIGVAMRHDDEGFEGEDVADSTESRAGAGAVTGAMAGLGLGALAGLGVLSGVIPVIGPAIAAGTLGVILSNVAAGAGIGGLVGALAGAGVPEDEAHYYQGEFESGRTIVTVQSEGRADEARAILRRYDAYDMSSRPEIAGYDESVARTATAGRTAKMSGSTRGTARAASSREGDTIQVKEEQLHAEKRPVEAGEVRVRKEVHTEKKTIEVPVRREEVVIERTPVHGRAATQGIAADAIREGEEIRIPVREEQVEVSKRAVVTEEVKVGKRVVQDTERVTGDVRKEEVKIEQKGDVDVKTRGPGKKSS
jgi:uncharacterized protein (TIGR02271 family)